MISRFGLNRGRCCSKVIDSFQEFTVAAEGEEFPENYDFACLHDALVFVEETEDTPGKAIALLLADGTHYIKRDPRQPSFNGNAKGAYNFSAAHLFIDSMSYDKTKAVITLDPALGDVDNGYIFRANNSKLSFSNVTIDIAASETNSKVYAIFRISASYFYSNNFEIVGKEDNKTTFAYYIDGQAFIYDIDIVVKNFIIVYLDAPSMCYVNSMLSVVENVDMLCYTYMQTLSNIFLYGAGFDSSLVPNNMLNRITAAGGIVHDNNVYNPNTPPAMYKWAGTTDDRPDMSFLNGEPWGGVYFDTDLGKPIWWRGDKWVDATGAEV